jgi:hypothetical protein
MGPTPVPGNSHSVSASTTSNNIDLTDDINLSSATTSVLGTVSPGTIPLVMADPVDEIQIKEVLSHLSKIDLISDVVHRWFESSQMCFIPGVFCFEALASLESAESRLKQGSVDTNRLAADILQATSKPFEIPSDIQPLDFPRLFTGENLRLEIIGLLFSYVGVATMFATPRSSKAETRTFAASMLSASDACIAICERSFNLNDIMVWLRAENLRLTRNMAGSASK